MNREADIEQTLRRWFDHGADQAPERFVRAALESVERTAQRGSGRMPLEGFLMKLKPAAPFLGVAAILVLIFGAYQLFAGANFGEPQPTTTPQAFTPADLPNIVVTEANAPSGIIVDKTTAHRRAIRASLGPGSTLLDQPGFVDALMTDLNTTEVGKEITWSALFTDAPAAEQAYGDLVAELAGEGLTHSDGPRLGDESVMWSGTAFGFDRTTTYLWRDGNLLLAAVGLGDHNPSVLRALADLMAFRTR
jgi:hypothetical protein